MGHYAKASDCILLVGVTLDNLGPGYVTCDHNHGKTMDHDMLDLLAYFSAAH